MVQQDRVAAFHRVRVGMRICGLQVTGRNLVQSTACVEEQGDAVPQDAFEFQLGILSDEITTIHTRIAAFDDLAFRIKGWAATLWAGLVGYAVSQDVPGAILVSIPLMVVFWILDALFKRYQQHVRARMGIIESFLNSTSNEPGESLARAFKDRSFRPFVVHDPMCFRTVKRKDAEFQAYFKRKTSMPRAMLTRNVYLIYAGLIAGSLVMYAYVLLTKHTEQSVGPEARAAQVLTSSSFAASQRPTSPDRDDSM